MKKIYFFFSYTESAIRVLTNLNHYFGDNLYIIKRYVINE